jgi:hypothetical protein
MRKFWMTSLGLMAVAVACAPAAVAPFNFSDGTRLFTLSVNGQGVPARGEAFTYRGAGFDADLRLGRQFIRVDLRNTSDANLRVVWDGSSLELPDGRLSEIGLEQTTNVNVARPSGPTLLPPRARLVTNLYPVGNRGFQTVSGLNADPMFIFPIRATTTIRLTLALETPGQRDSVRFTFLAQPQP